MDDTAGRPLWGLVLETVKVADAIPAAPEAVHMDAVAA